MKAAARSWWKVILHCISCMSHSSPVSLLSPDVDGGMAGISAACTACCTAWHACDPCLLVTELPVDRAKTGRPDAALHAQEGRGSIYACRGPSDVKIQVCDYAMHASACAMIDAVAPVGRRTIRSRCVRDEDKPDSLISAAASACMDQLLSSSISSWASDPSPTQLQLLYEFCSGAMHAMRASHRSEQ